MKYPSKAPSTEATVVIAAKRNARDGRPAPIAINSGSGGKGKKLDSANDNQNKDNEDNKDVSEGKHPIVKPASDF